MGEITPNPRLDGAVFSSMPRYQQEVLPERVGKKLQSSGRPAESRPSGAKRPFQPASPDEQSISPIDTRGETRVTFQPRYG
jgi:hypothetical protein